METQGLASRGVSKVIHRLTRNVIQHYVRADPPSAGRTSRALTTVRTRTCFLALLIGSIGATAVAAPLKPWNNHLVAATIAWSSELANNKADPSISLLEVKLISVPLQMGECWGKVTSCPDEVLLISAVEDGLYMQPILFRLPKAKAWEFVRWLPTKVKANNESQVGFIVRTGLPEANIDPLERERFSVIEYEVWLTSRGGSFVARKSDGQLVDRLDRQRRKAP